MAPSRPQIEGQVFMNIVASSVRGLLSRRPDADASLISGFLGFGGRAI